jgi:hypothetical protein
MQHWQMYEKYVPETALRKYGKWWSEKSVVLLLTAKEKPASLTGGHL